MKRNNFFIYPILLIIEIALCLKGDLFIDNISGYADNIYRYIFVLGFGIILGISFMMAVKNFVSKKIQSLLMISSIMPVYLPYLGSNSIISQLHILSAYIGFALLTTINIYIFYGLSVLSKKMKNIFKVYVFMLTVILVLNLYFLGINNLMEMIYLVTTTFIYGLVYINRDTLSLSDCN